MILDFSFSYSKYVIINRKVMSSIGPIIDIPFRRLLNKHHDEHFSLVERIEYTIKYFTHS